MKSKRYLNKNNEELYVLHFPGDGIRGNEYIIEENLNREIIVSDNLSVISIMNKPCWEKSPIRIQCENNNIPIYNTAMKEKDWVNTAKIKHILSSLEMVKTEYVLIVDGRDVTFVNNLDDEFIRKFKEFGSLIIYNGTPVSYPPTCIEPLIDIIAIKGKQKYLNAGVCIGYKDALIDFYTKAFEVHKSIKDNKSEQLIIRKTRIKHPGLAEYDTDNKIFRIVHRFDTIVKQIDEETTMFI